MGDDRRDRVTFKTKTVSLRFDDGTPPRSPDMRLSVWLYRSFFGDEGPDESYRRGFASSLPPFRGVLPFGAGNWPDVIVHEGLVYQFQFVDRRHDVGIYVEVFPADGVVAEEVRDE